MQADYVHLFMVAYVWGIPVIFVGGLLACGLFGAGGDAAGGVVLISLLWAPVLVAFIAFGALSSPYWFGKMSACWFDGHAKRVKERKLGTALRDAQIEQDYQDTLRLINS